MQPASSDLSVLVIAPVGRDASLIKDALASVNMDARVLGTVEEAAKLSSQHSVGALVIAEEVMNAANIEALTDGLARQQSWSDLPVLILTVGGKATPLSRRREQERVPLGNVSLLERPIRIATLISSVRSALQSRGRQYQVRDTLLERDLAEKSRRDSENRLRLAVDTAHLGTWDLNISTGVLLASATCRHSFDWTAEQPLKQEDWLLRVHPEDRAAVEEVLRECIETRCKYGAEYRIVRRDGTIRWISATGRFLDNETALLAIEKSRTDELRMAGVTLDITERVLSEAALRKADKLALVGRLASSIAHEINNPLEAVTNLLYLLELSELSVTQRGYVLMAQQEVARISEIAVQTLSFNRPQNLQERVILPDVLDSVLALYQGRLTTSNIQVQRRYGYRQPVPCYPGEIRQVFTNLIGNAFDATRRGGRIVVRERIAKDPRTEVAGVRVTIADTGTGMSAEVKNRLFEAFHSTKGNNGTGLGLWISKGIVQKHGGSLRFRSSEAAQRSGSVFSVFIPL